MESKLLTKSKVQLLQVTKSSPKEEAYTVAKKSKEQIENENLQQMILDKMNIFESITPAEELTNMTDLYAGATEDKLEQ